MSRTSVATLARLERDRRALRLRYQGMPWAEIARECGFNAPHSAMVAVQTLIKRETHADVETSRGIARGRIEMLIRLLQLPVLTPGLSQKAAEENAQPKPPSQERAIELLRKLLDDLSDIEG